MQAARPSLCRELIRDVDPDFHGQTLAQKPPNLVLLVVRRPSLEEFADAPQNRLCPAPMPGRRRRIEGVVLNLTVGATCKFKSWLATREGLGMMKKPLRFSTAYGTCSGSASQRASAEVLGASEGDGSSQFPLSLVWKLAFRNAVGCSPFSYDSWPRSSRRNETAQPVCNVRGLGAKGPDSFRIGQSGSDPGPLSRSKSPFGFP